MKLRIINIIEIILSLTFILGFFLTKLNVADLGWVALISSILLGFLYFPIGFYTLKSPDILTANAISFGILFSISVAAIMFSLMRIDLSYALLIAWICIFLMTAGLRAYTVYLFTQWRILEYNNWIAVRYLILFVFMIYATLSYKIN